MAALTLSMLCVAGAAHPGAAQTSGSCNMSTPCSPVTPSISLPAPQVVPGSICGGSYVAAPLQTPDVDFFWPTNIGQVVSTNVFATGVPFYVEATDLDKFLPKCQQTADPVYQEVTVFDEVRYRWEMQPPDPAIGKLYGAEDLNGQVDNLWSSAVVFRPHRELAPGDYSVMVSVDCIDTGLETRVKDGDQYAPRLTWRIDFTVNADCTAPLMQLVPPIDPGSGGLPTTLREGACCGTSHFFTRGMALTLESDRIPDTVVTGRYTVVDARFVDRDYLVVRCEDLPQYSDCEDSGQQGDFGPFKAGDPISYSWHCERPNGLGAGGLAVPNASEHAVILFTQDEGEHQVCVSVIDSGQGGDSCERLIKTVRSSGFPLAVLGRGPMSPQQVELSMGCEAIRLYVNNDDDGKLSPPAADNTHAQAIPSEDDMYEIHVVPLLPLLPGQSLSVRFRPLGQQTFRVFRQGNHTQLWNALGATWDNRWLPLSAQGMNVWLEGLSANLAVAGSQLAIDVRTQNPGPNASTSQFTTLIDCTVFGITSVTLNTTEDPASNGYGHAKLWSSVPAAERPDNFTTPANLSNAYFIEPDPRLPLDTKVGGNWNGNHRNELLTTVTVQPGAAGVRVYLRSLDVDDNSLPEVENNFVDDAPAVALDAHDNYGQVTPEQPAGAAPTRQGVLRLAQNGSQTFNLISVETGSEPAATADGQVRVYLRTTLAMADNFRVLATLAAPHAANGAAADVAATIMSPGPRLGLANDYVTSPLAYRRNNLAANMGYVSIPAGQLAAGSQSLSSHAVAVRRVFYVEEERVNGVLDAEGLVGDAWELGMRRWIARIDDYAVPPATPVRYTRFGTLAIPATPPFKKIDWAGRADESPNLSSRHLVDVSLDVMEAPPIVPIPANVFPLPAIQNPMFLGPLEDGRLVLLDFPRTTFEIAANGSIDVLSPRAVGQTPLVPIKIIRVGLPDHQGFLTSMTPDAPALAPAAGLRTKFVLSAAVPGVLDGNTLIEISGVQTALEALAPSNAARTELYAATSHWVFPCVLYGDDERWPISRPAVDSELDLLAHDAANNQYSLVNHYLRNLPVRVQRLSAGYSETWPFGPASGVHGYQAPLFKDLVQAVSRSHGEALHNEERLWITHSIWANESEPLIEEIVAGGFVGIDERDGDADTLNGPTPVGPEFLAGVQNRSLPGKSMFFTPGPAGPVLSWLVLSPESCREHYRHLYPAADWNVAFFAQRGANHRDVLRARVFAHELMHQLLRPPGALPPRGDGVATDIAGQQVDNVHFLPGIMMPANNAGRDPALGVFMQGASKFDFPAAPGGAMREADLGSYPVWHARRHIRFPYTNR